MSLLPEASLIFMSVEDMSVCADECVWASVLDFDCEFRIYAYTYIYKELLLLYTYFQRQTLWISISIFIWIQKEKDTQIVPTKIGQFNSFRLYF